MAAFPSGTDGLIVTTDVTPQAPQTSPNCASTSSTSTTSTTSTSAVCSPSPANICPPLYPVCPPYIVMGISVQPFTYPPPPQSTDLAVAPRVVTAGNRKRPNNNKLLPPEVKRRARKRRRQHGDVVSSTTPDSSLLETTSGSRVFPFPAEMTSLPVDEAELTSPLCLAVSRDKLVYDSCGALDLTVRK